MRQPLQKLFLSALLSAACCSLRAQVSVTTGLTATQLAQRLAGGGISVSNVELKCPSGASGSFTATSATGLGLDSGIILTTGRAKTGGGIDGINGTEADFASTNNGAGGDPALETLAGNTTKDACILEFDFVPAGDTIRMEYVFGSEEYINATCGDYNDAFAFFISGPGITGTKNIALVPGTSIPVTVNSINNGIPGPSGDISNCTSMGPGAPFTSLYQDNSGGSYITYKGFTKALRAQQAVVPCATYHLKFAIADAGNAIYDSGVMLRSGSLITNTSVTVDAIGAAPGSNVLGRGCTPGNLIFTAGAATAVPRTLHFVISGTATNGSDYTLLPDSIIIPAFATTATLPVQALAAPGGTETLEIFLQTAHPCLGTFADSATFIIKDAPSADILNADTVICKGQNILLRTAALGSELQFSWSPATGLNDATLLNPLAAPADDITYTLSVSLPNSGCAPASDAVHITVNETPQVFAGDDTQICTATPLVIDATVSAADPYNFFWTGPAGFSTIAPDTVINDAPTSAAGMYVATVTVEGCAPVRDTMIADVGMSIPPPPEPEPVSVCQNTAVPLIADNTNIVWFATQAQTVGTSTAPVVSTATLGQQTIYIAATSGACVSPKVPVHIKVRRCCEDYMLIPNAFSPNGDGRNDLFSVVHGPEAFVPTLDIYNRWGQRIYSDFPGTGWDGTYNGVPQPAGVYFYNIEIRCSGGLIQRQGELTLVR